MFVASVSRAVRSVGKSGFECAIGHTIVELPLVIGLAIGSVAWLQRNPVALRGIGLINGIVLLVFAFLQAWEARRLDSGLPSRILSPKETNNP